MKNVTRCCADDVDWVCWTFSETLRFRKRCVFRDAALLALFSAECWDPHAHWEPYHTCFREGSEIKWLGARRRRPISAPQAKKISLITCSFIRFYTIFRARTVLRAPPEATKNSLLPLLLPLPLLLLLLLLLLLRHRLCRRRCPCHCCRARPSPSAPDRRPALPPQAPLPPLSPPCRARRPATRRPHQLRPGNSLAAAEPRWQHGVVNREPL